MKIIDLLNKLANGEKYSSKARIRFFDNAKSYINVCNINIYDIGYGLYNFSFTLNSEIEIIEITDLDIEIENAIKNNEIIDKLNETE